jgi:uracil-DNA glycosylase
VRTYAHINAQHRAHKANSHAQIGWQTFTDAVIRTISDERTGIVFVLWGEFAKKKAALIDAKKHAVIQVSAHGKFR